MKELSGMLVECDHLQGFGAVRNHIRFPCSVRHRHLVVS
jgi:hypothetical protein